VIKVLIVIHCIAIAIVVKYIFVKFYMQAGKIDENLTEDSEDDNEN